jgi:Holliday junction resolvase RusA-like endonuclease
MADVFEIVVAGTPVSNQARRRERLRLWIARVAAELRQSWPDDREPWAGPVGIAITHYFAEVPIDLDNLPKPILDAMKGITIVDDMQVVELVVRKRRTLDAVRSKGPSALVAGALATWPEFTHIRVVEIINDGDVP